MELHKIGKNQPALVILCYPKDKLVPDDQGTSRLVDGGLTLNEETERQRRAFERLVNTAFRQMSYDKFDLRFHYTGWCELPHDDRYYFYRQADIDELQDALDALPSNASEEERAELEEELQRAKDNKNGRRYDEALSEIRNSAFEFARENNYQPEEYAEVIICIATGFLRGWNLGGERTTIIHTGAHWGRRVHEICHDLGLDDIYGDSAEMWDPGGQVGQLPLFSGHNITKYGWYGDKVKELNFAVATSHDETFIVQAHGGITPSGDPNTYHLIKIEVFPELRYFVEVRQRPKTVPPALTQTRDGGDFLPHLGLAADVVENDPDQIIFDPVIPLPTAQPAHGGGVIVTKMATSAGREVLNQRMSSITLLDEVPKDVGGEIVDAARNLKVKVLEKVRDRPLAYRIQITWDHQAVADPHGLINIRIRPWDHTWQTNDIWIDSKANCYDTYEDTIIEPVTGNPIGPIGSGDRPWVNHGNRLYAMIHNFGIVDAHDVQVTFYTNSPPGVGDRGSWIPLSVKTIPFVPKGGSERVPPANWIPPVERHTCIKVAAELQTGETDVQDNIAQENVFHFDTESGSAHRPIFQEISVQNPRKKWNLIRLSVEGLTPGWEVTLEHAWLWLPPLGEKRVRYVLFTDRGRERPLTLQGQKVDKIAKRVQCRIVGTTMVPCALGEEEPNAPMHKGVIGGIQVVAEAKTGVRIDLNPDFDAARQGHLRVTGQIEPPLSGVKVILELRDGDKTRVLDRVQTDTEGRFEYDSNKAGLQLPRGERGIQAWIQGDSQAADVSSPLVTIRIGG